MIKNRNFRLEPLHTEEENCAVVDILAMEGSFSWQ